MNNINKKCNKLAKILLMYVFSKHNMKSYQVVALRYFLLYSLN